MAIGACRPAGRRVDRSKAEESRAERWLCPDLWGRRDGNEIPSHLGEGREGRSERRERVEERK